jgi:hypothetical protein
MPRWLVDQIQRAVVKAINAGSLLVPDTAVTTPENIPVAQTSLQEPKNALSAAMLAAQTKRAVILQPIAPDDKEAA